MNFQSVTFEAAFGRADQLKGSDLPEIVFSGKSNVGKSSLVNALGSNRKLARVSQTPGKTQQIIYFDMDSQAILADLPGYGFAKVSKQEREKWGDLMEAYFASDRRIELVLSLIDIRHLPSQDDLNMIEFLNNYGFPFAVILTKVDKLSKKQREEMHKKISDSLGDSFSAKMIEFSAVKGTGVEIVKSAIMNAVEE